MKTCIGYARVSTEEQAREGISLENQEQKIKAYCQLYDYELVDMIVDAGQSAKNVNRDGMKKLFELTNKRKTEVDGIVIYKLDRLFRNAREALEYTEKWDHKGIALHSVQEQLDTKSAMGKFFFTLLAAVAEMERNVIGERTADALQCKKKNGHKTGGDVPYGFNVEIKDEVKVLVPNEEEQRVLGLVRKMRKQGKTLKAIAEELQKKKTLTKKGKEKWDPRQVKRLLDASQNDSSVDESRENEQK